MGTALVRQESQTALVRRARRIVRELASMYPDARCELDFGTPLELLVATILSARCTDAQVNRITPALFARYPEAAAYAAGDRAELESIIRPTGFFRAKTRSIMLMAQSICDDFAGEVPTRLDQLVSLPGVGRKTANVVLGNAFGVPGIAVDTHVGRLSRRLRWTTQIDPDKVEQDLMGLFPRPEWTAVSHRLVAHGRRCCRSRTPACGACGIARFCPSFGEGPTDPAVAERLLLRYRASEAR